MHLVPLQLCFRGPTVFEKNTHLLFFFFLFNGKLFYSVPIQVYKGKTTVQINSSITICTKLKSSFSDLKAEMSTHLPDLHNW